MRLGRHSAVAKCGSGLFGLMFGLALEGASRPKLKIAFFLVISLVHACGSPIPQARGTIQSQISIYKLLPALGARLVKQWIYIRAAPWVTTVICSEMM